MSSVRSMTFVKGLIRGPVGYGPDEKGAVSSFVSSGGRMGSKVMTLSFESQNEFVPLPGNAAPHYDEEKCDFTQAKCWVDNGLPCYVGCRCVDEKGVYDDVQ